MNINVICENTSLPSLDFSRVSREIRGLVARRRELMVFLGSLFAALSLFLDNLLHGNLPPALAGMAQQTFFNYSVMLLLPSLIIALRIMRLHGGMTINGIFYQRILEAHGDLTANPLNAGQLNWSGISTGLFLLTVIDTTLACMLFTFALKMGWMTALISAICCGLVLLALFLRNHWRACRFALDHIEQATVEPINSEEIEDHLALSLQDANQDMIGITAFVGLILFSVMQNLSGLGGTTQVRADITASDVLQFGPLVYAILALATATIGTLTYRRLAVAAGELAYKIDATDTPFAPFRLTDTFLGYLLLCALFGISLHLTFFIIPAAYNWTWWSELAINGLMVALYPLRMWRAGSKVKAIAAPL